MGTESDCIQWAGKSFWISEHVFHFSKDTNAQNMIWNRSIQSPWEYYTGYYCIVFKLVCKAEKIDFTESEATDHYFKTNKGEILDFGEM